MRRGMKAVVGLGTAAALLLPLAVAAGASAHRSPCHARHTCPSDNHTYAWHGLICTSPKAKRLNEDQSGGELTGSYIKGKLDTAGNGSGVVHVAASFDYGGTHYTCLFDTEWTAKLGA